MRWGGFGAGLAGLWLTAAVVADVVIGPNASFASLYAVAPLIACALLPAAVTAGVAVAAVALAAASGGWDHTWGSTQHAVRMVDVALVGSAGVAVAAVRVRREQRHAQVASIAEAATRETREATGRLSAVLDTMLDAVAVGTAVRDEAGRIVDFRVDYVNAVFGQVLGRPAEEHIGRRWSEVYPTPFAGEMFPTFARAVETGEPVELLAHAVTAEGAAGLMHLVVDLRAARLGDGLVVVFREVSAQRQAALAAAAANAQFAAVFDHAPVGMVLVDPARVILRTNEAFGIISGRHPDELVGMSLDALIDPRDVPESRADFARLMSGEEPVYVSERRLVTSGGDVRWAAVRGARVEGPGDDNVYAVEHIEDIEERKAFEGRLQHLADHDALTGLFNRRRFHEELAHQVILDARYGRTSALMLIDLDNFKYINDTLGHATGDQLIQVIAGTLRGRLRDSDVIGRLGGDEFGVLLAGADELDAVAVAETLLDAVRASKVDYAGQRVRSTASIGVVPTEHAQGDDADDLLAHADLAMYAAKDAGRDTRVVYDPGGPHAERFRARFRWLDRIRHALDHNLFTLQIQPILDLATAEVTGCELLIRMREKDRLVHPDQFLDIAERHGLATAIDRWVITHGVALIAALPRPAGFRWEINLSADSLADPGIPDLIESTLAARGVAPGAVVFEITETAVIANIAQAQAFASRITDMGCRFALDDFGAGYASFYYLKHLPFEYLKIDGEFIRHLPTNDTDRIIVEAIVTAARRLGKQTIAEHVPDAATLTLLRTLHVDHAQGNHIGRPSTPEICPATPTPPSP